MEIKAQSDAYLLGLEESRDRYYWHDPRDASRDVVFQDFIKEKGILDEERRLKESHYVLYHCAHGMRLYRDLISLLEGREFTYMRPPSKYFNSRADQIASELKTGEVALRRFQLAFDEVKERISALDERDTERLYHVLRGEVSDARAKHSLGAIGAALQDVEGLFYIDDHRPSVGRELISCNPSIYCSGPGESAYSFWGFRENVHSFDKSELLASVLDHYGISYEHLPELLEIEKMIEANDHAIVAFYLPKDPDLIDRNVYVAEPYGRPSSIHAKASQVFAQLQTDPARVVNLADLQMRLVVRNDDLLSPDSGIRVKVFDEIGKKTLADYQERLSQWAWSLDQRAVA